MNVFDVHNTLSNLYIIKSIYYGEPYGVEPYMYVDILNSITFIINSKLTTMKLTIAYQSQRSVIPCDSYYPEDNRTPKKRVDFILNLVVPHEQEEFKLVSACPYVIEATIKRFGYENNLNTLTCFIDDEECDIQDIFTELSEPMQKLL